MIAREKTAREQELEQALAAEKARADREAVEQLQRRTPAVPSDIPGPAYSAGEYHTWARRHGHPLGIEGRTYFPDGAVIMHEGVREEPAGPNADPTRRKVTLRRRKTYWEEILRLAYKDWQKLKDAPHLYGAEGMEWDARSFGPAPDEIDYKTWRPCVKAAIRRLEEIIYKAQETFNEIEAELATLPSERAWAVTVASQH